MHKVTVEGTYVTAGRTKDIEFFEEEFILNEGNKALARAIIQNGLIKDRLRKTKKNFGFCQECQVIKIEEASGDSSAKPDPEIEALLVEATNLACIPVNYNSYKDNASRKRRLREAIEKKKERIKKALEKEGKEVEIEDVD